jgi:dihydrofolate synthase/folylpolyglutamate synthase
MRGRYQLVAGPPPCLVDVAHNPAGIAAFARMIEHDERLAGRPRHLVFTALADRPVEEMFALLAPVVASAAVCPVASTRTLSADALAVRLPRAEVHPSVEEALAAAQNRARRDGGVVLVCGSSFLAGEALALLTGELRDPPIDG